MSRVLSAGHRTYTTTAVASIANVSYRQLQWWDEEGVVSPRHYAHQRLYSLADVVEVSVIAELRRKGLSLQKVRSVFYTIRREIAHRLAANDSRSLYLMTDGQTVFLESNNGRFLERLKRATRGVFVVCVQDHVRRAMTYQSPE